MIVVRSRIAGVLLAGLLVIASVSVSAGITTSSDEGREIESAMNFRASFGLATDPAYVRDLEQDPGADRKYSVALSALEVAELDRRMAVQNALEPLVDYSRLFPETFGGVYVDHKAGGVVYFGFTDSLTERSAALRAIAPPGADIRFVQVERSEAELDALVSVVLGDLTHQGGLGIKVHDVGTNVPDNGIEIFVEPYTAEVATALEKRYGPGTRVLPGKAPQLTACVNRDNCHPPIRGGVSNDWGCSVGFGVIEDGHRRMLTAGHCVSQVVNLYGWGGWEWFHNTQSLGLSSDHSWYYDSKADAGTMGNITAAVHTNNVLNTLTPTSWDITSQQGAASDFNGFMVCQSGQTSGVRCGQIISTNRSPTYEDGTRMRNQRLASYTVGVGDSGAPVLSSANRSMAVGLQSGMDGPNLAYYSHIGHVEAELFLQVSFTE